jgi:hypothetical protein
VQRAKNIAQWLSACLAYVKPWFRSSALQKRKTHFCRKRSAITQENWQARVVVDQEGNSPGVH